MSAIRHIRARARAIAAECRIAIVMSRYNYSIGERLLDGCLRTLDAAGVKEKHITLLEVPGALEIPLAASHLAGSNAYDAIISLGAVIRGETAHFDLVCTECSRGLSALALKTRLPMISGVLAVDKKEQAIARSGDKNNKGSECAAAALEMISVLRQLA